ncbi:LEAF RUST 10 DISEASE-RESISTANCE LOCUS RECEPTOR-LIKE PROTEIN KINASE-like 1.2 [Bienertia sinuspersici]
MITLIIFSFHSFTLTIFIILLTLSTSNGDDHHKYNDCSSSLMSCGSLRNVGYPFWGVGRPQYCGHPALQLQCNLLDGEKYPVLKIGDDDEQVQYHVLGITTTPNMTIKLHETSCLFHGFRKKFDEIFFQFTEKVVNVTLFYDCNEPHMEGVLNCTVPCWNKQTTAYYCLNKAPLNKQLEETLYDVCKQLQIPVLKKELDHLQPQYNPVNKTLLEVLDEGFEVEYLNSSACSECQNSGGMCGSNHTGFACFRRKSAIPGILILIALNVGFWCYLKRKFYSPILQSSRLLSVPMNSDLEIGSSFYGIPREVAVKRLYEKNYKQMEQFMNEIEILTRLRHPNLVTLYGCTSRNSRELLLVYEYIPNGTVADHLYGERKGSKTLSWDIRMRIAIGTARALSYLHASDIVHRDVKTNNILLDNKFSVKVADFGLSRLFPSDATHVSTVPQGTPGYLDPQYHKNYQVTNKSDVYSFGVVLVELISSLPAVDISRQEDEINLYDYAMNKIQHGILNELVDQRIGFESDFKVNRMVTLVAELAFRCLQQEKEHRPTMDEVLQALEEIGSTDYDALKAVDTTRSKSASKLTPTTVENHIEPPLGNAHPPPSPNSVIDSWISRSSASTTSS